MDYSSLFSSGLRAITRRKRPSSMSNVPLIANMPAIVTDIERAQARGAGSQAGPLSPFSALGKNRLFNRHSAPPQRKPKPAGPRPQAHTVPKAAMPEVIDVWITKGGPFSPDASTSYLSFDDDSDPDSPTSLKPVDLLAASSPAKPFALSFENTPADENTPRTSFFTFSGADSPIDSPAFTPSPRRSPPPIQTTPILAHRSGSPSAFPLTPVGGESACSAEGELSPAPVELPRLVTDVGETDGGNDWREVIDHVINRDQSSALSSPSDSD